MKDLKFRVWDNVDYMSNTFTLSDVQERKIQFTKDCKVMLFTGLYDANGDEIWEGDILYYTIDVYDQDEPEEFKEVVIFSDGQFCIEHNELSAMHKKCTVIGNEYQNPKLLS